jgi:hypothetical protein
LPKSVKAFANFSIFSYIYGVSAVEIIEQIRCLPVEEREKVLDFSRLNLASGQLTGEELVALGEKMIAADDPAEIKRIEDEMVSGSYGEVPHA